MKVYVVKRIDGKYLSGYNNYDYRLENPCKPCWTEKLYNAKIFEEYEEADNFCTIDCQIVECSFMEPTELTDYTKQVRKKVVNFIDKCFEMQKYESIWINPDKTEFSCDVSYAYEWWESFRKILLDKIQGE